MVLLVYYDNKEVLVRIAHVFLIVMFCCVMLSSTGCSSSNQQNKELPVLEECEKFKWPEGKHGAISITFDDARFSQIDTGLPILDEYNAKATFYVSIGSLKKRLDDWKKAAANGHEIGNHSLTHPCSGNFSFAYEKALENCGCRLMEVCTCGCHEESPPKKPRIDRSKLETLIEHKKELEKELERIQKRISQLKASEK